MKIFKKAYCTYEEVYEIEVNETYVKSVNDELRQRSTEPIPLITADEIYNIINGEDVVDDLYRPRRWKSKWSNEFYESSIYSQVLGILNEDLWQVDPETSYIDTDYTDEWGER